MSKDLHNDEEITIDLLEIANILKRNAGNIARVTGIFVVAAGVYLATATPVYESQALLRVKQPKGIGTSLLESMPMGNAMANTQLMNTYAEILKSRSVVVPVIQKTEQPNKEGKYPAYDAYVKGRITTAPFKDTEIMQLTVRANTPEKAQEANKLIVDGFLKRLTDLSRDQQKATRGFLEERAVAAKNELQTAEDKLTDYKKKNNIIAPDDAVKLASEKMSMVDKLSAENKVALATANARLAAANGQLQGEAVSIADNRTIQSYNAKLAELEGERISYMDKYTENHPKVQQVNQEIAGLKAKIQNEINKVAALQAPSDNPVHQQLLASKFSSEAEASVAQSNLAKLAQIDGENKNGLKELSDKEQQFVGLLRDVTVANEIYVMLAKRLEEAKVAEASVATDYLIKGTRIVLLAMLMGGIVFYYLYNKKRPSFKSVIIGCITLVLFMSFIQISRNSVRYGQGISIDMVCENIGVGNVFDSDMTTYKAFYCIIDTYPDKHDYTLGRAMILQTFTTLIPRSIWSDKPVAVIREVIENSVNSSAAKAGRAAPGIAEYYFEFGIIGCFICMFILGLLFKKWKNLFTNSQSVDDYILYSILYGLMFQLIIRTSTSASIYQYLFTVLPVIFIKKSIYLK